MYEVRLNIGMASTHEAAFEGESNSANEATMQLNRVRADVLGVPIDVATWELTLERMSQWAAHRDGRYICITNVHSVVEATRDEAFHKIIEGADFVAADGAPVAWFMRIIGFDSQRRISGPDLMLRYCELAAGRGESIFLYGGTDSTLALLCERLRAMFPELIIAGKYSPPFRDLREEEETAIADLINSSGAATVWVGLGCPKQERWMASQSHRIGAVMIGVGAAFDYHAGVIQRAPEWMRDSGMEWLFRLVSEPRRLWRRYLTTNTLFIWQTLVHLTRHGLSRRLYTK